MQSLHGPDHSLVRITDNANRHLVPYGQLRLVRDVARMT